MRVLYWTELFWPYVGGVEILSAQLLPALVRRGHEIQVVTSHGALALPDTEEWEGIPLRRIRLQQALENRDVEQIARARNEVAALRRSFRPDLVHLNVTAGSVYYELRTRQNHPCPVLLSVGVALPEHGAGADTALGAAFSAAAWITANSEAIGSDIRRLVPACADRLSVIPNGLAVPKWEPSPLRFDPPTILCLGRLVADKGFDIAVDCLRLVLARFPDTRLVVAGDGPERVALEEQAEKLGLASRVTFPGWVAPERVPALMDTASVVVVPSRWREAFGLVALQAALMGRPVIATRVGGLPEVVEEDVTGLLVTRDDDQAMAEAICEVLADPAGAARMGQLGRLRAIADFGLDAHVAAYDRLYARLCP